MNKTESVQYTATADHYRSERVAHWDGVARRRRPPRRGMRRNYHDYLRKHYRFHIPAGLRVLEIGCAEGDLLAAVEPSFGVGVDFSPLMLETARERHPHLRFVEADAHALDPAAAPDLAGPFDAVILSDLVNDAWDVLELFKRLRTLCADHTRIVINFHSHLWEHPFQWYQKSGKVTPRLAQNWFTVNDIENLLALAGFDRIQQYDGFLWPWDTPVLAPLCNRYLSRIAPFSFLDLTHFVVCRPQPVPSGDKAVSIIVPARNEAGNIEQVLERTPDIGSRTEIVFVEGNSTDDTWAVIEEARARHAHRNVLALRQEGKGKWDAVRKGFEAATGDIFMILDADLTVPPETLPSFYEAVVSGRAEFVNGVRLVYPQEKKAMRFMNLLGNKFFSLAFSWMLGRPVKDTLCGTKVLSRENYRKIADNRKYFGEFDPFGDFDLLFGAAKLDLKIVDLPVRYRARLYGDTNISRWRDGCVLLRLVLFAARRIKFI